MYRVDFKSILVIFVWYRIKSSYTIHALKGVYSDLKYYVYGSIGNRYNRL